MRRVERERENLDLVLRWPGAAPLVIENKVFSLPERAQLDEYRGKTARWKGAPAQHILLSMSPPRDPVDGWTYLSYQELAERIDLALADLDDSSYEVETVRRYSRVVRLLSALLDTTVVHSPEESAWLDSSQLAEIDSKQTRTALRKLRARHVQAVLAAEGPGVGWDGGRHQPQSAASRLASSHSGRWRRDPSRLAVPGGTIPTVCRAAASRGTLGWRARTPARRSPPSTRSCSTSHRCSTSLHRRTGRSGRVTGSVHFAPSFIYRYVKAPDQTVEQLIAATHAINDSLQAVRG